MKKLITAILSFLTLSAFANTSATLNLKGNVALLLNISVALEALATSLPLDRALSGQKVGTITEKSNSHTGYKLSVSSKNGGKLVRTGDTAHFVNYSLEYNGDSIPLNSNPAVISSNSRRGEFGRELKISYTKPSEYLAAGEYTDVVTFSIAAK